MFLQTSITNRFVLLFYLLQSSNAYYSEYNVTDCLSSRHNYTKDSHYHHNLKLLLSSLARSTPATGFFNGTQASSNGSNEVFGLAMCRGDLKLPQECIPCLEYAVNESEKLCPNKASAAVLYDRCFLRYSNKDFFGVATGTERYTEYNKEISKDREKFIEVREKLFQKLLVEALDGSKSPKFFAADGEAVSSDLNVFGLLQCTRDLSKEACHQCLKMLVAEIPNFGNYYVGLMFLGRSCFGIYENKLFYNGNMPPPLPPEESKGNLKEKMIGGFVGAGAFIVVVVFGLWLWRNMRNKKAWKKKKSTTEGDAHQQNNNDENDGSKIVGIEHLSLKFEDLARATDNFSRKNIIGRGGFGFVYKGILNKQEVAVKKMIDNNSPQADGQLEKEVTLLAKLQHVNLVRLIGYCIKEKEMLLVYEYMANGSLEKYIFDPNSNAEVLNWTSRLKIICGIVKGLQYLHEDSRLKIFHRDLKPENILLDQNMTPKITDFGISKSSDINQTQESVSTKIVGTSGYMAPEYRLYGQFTLKSDVYSLGVMLLEILTGKKLSRRNNTPQIQNLKSYMLAFWKDAEFENKLAKIENETYTTAQEITLKNTLQIAMRCIENDPELRPEISVVRDFINLANNSSFSLSHMSTISEGSSQYNGIDDDSNSLVALTFEITTPMRNMP